MGSAQSEPACSHMAVVEPVASVISGSAIGEHAVPSTSFGNGHLHILRVIQGIIPPPPPCSHLSFLHAHLRMHTFVVIHKWKIDLLIVKNEGTVNSVYLL